MVVDNRKKKQTGTLSNPYWQADMAKVAAESKAALAPGSGPSGYKWETENWKQPYANAANGSAQQTANSNYAAGMMKTGNRIDSAIASAPSGFEKFGMGLALAPIAAIGGGVIAPAVSGAVGGLGGSVLGGAAGGAFAGGGNALFTGGNIGKGLLTGAIAGGVGGAAKGLLQGSGLTGPSAQLGNFAASTGSKALTGAITNGIYGTPGGGSSNSGGGSPNGSGMSYLGAGALGAGAGMLGQGNNGNMASTDSTLASTFAGALPGVLQGAAGVYGSQNAAEKQTQADQNAINTQNTNLGNINNIWKTQQGLGQGAQTALGTALGTNGQPADYSGFENMPGYKFAVQQGTQAIQRQAAAMGNAYTPNTAAAVGQYVTGTASQDYNTYISQLMGAAGLGSTANTGLQTAQQSNANNVGQLQQNQGQAQASGVAGASNAVGGLFSPNGAGTSLVGAGANWLKGALGGGGGGGNSAGGGGGVNGGGSNYSNDTGYGVSMNNPYTGTGNGTWGSGVDPSTGSSWASNSAPSFDMSGYNMPSMPSIDTGGLTDFGGGLDYGSGATNDMWGGGTDFLGGF